MALKHDIAKGALLGPKISGSFIAMRDLSLRA
jgi:hypothetical protein